MNLVAKLEFECFNINRVIYLNDYDEDVVLTITDNEAELAFSNGQVTYGRVLEKNDKGNLNYLLNAQVFKDNYTKFQITLTSDSAHISAGKMMKLH
ncbi:hypothetical protein [Photobacterium leiognathi]|uniref:hypothetical protein n=1 Tax=Photobacterium leiognathi TaxID=553611 RepID=UPI0029824280|nr:hypothetical protein [Photobacterium leiognathi]